MLYHKVVQHAVETYPEMSLMTRHLLPTMSDILQMALYTAYSVHGKDVANVEQHTSMDQCHTHVSTHAVTKTHFKMRKCKKRPLTSVSSLTTRQEMCQQKVITVYKKTFQCFYAVYNCTRTGISDFF